MFEVAYLVLDNRVLTIMYCWRPGYIQCECWCSIYGFICLLSILLFEQNVNKDSSLFSSTVMTVLIQGQSKLFCSFREMMSLRHTKPTSVGWWKKASMLTILQRCTPVWMWQFMLIQLPRQLKRGHLLRRKREWPLLTIALFYDMLQSGQSQVTRWQHLLSVHCPV